MKLPLIAALALTTLTAACGPDPSQVLVDPVPTTVKLRASVRTVEVKSISLPSYADGDDVTILAGGAGVLTVVKNNVWADDPARAMGESLVRSLIEMTGVTAATEPWPLAGFPEAEVTVRVARLLARDGEGQDTAANVAARRARDEGQSGDDPARAEPMGVLELSGSYALRYDAPGRRGKVRLFDIRVPLTGPGAIGVAEAQGRAWAQLAERIARDL